MTSPKPHTSPSHPRRRRRLLLLGAALLTICALPWLTFQAAVAWWPYPAGLDRARQPSTCVQDRRGEPMAAFVADDGEWYLPLTREQAGPHLLAALVAAEDSRFYRHHGVDWPAVASSAWEDLKAVGIRRGASTITMQVQRLRDPRPRGFFAKFEQAVRACQLEKQLPPGDAKALILLEYANRAPFGGNLVGAGAASWRYFGRPCRDLSLAQAALLAGLPQSPVRLRPDRFPERAHRRRDYVLGRMLATGVVTGQQYRDAVAEPIDARWRPLPQEMDAGQAASPDADRNGETSRERTRGTGVPPVRSQPGRLYHDDRQAPPLTVFGSMPTLKWLTESHPGPIVRTTLDTAVQSEAFDAAREQLEALGPSGVTAAAVVVLDTQSAECLAAVSLSRDASGVDLTRSPRSTGSTLKPFIYAAAFDDGIATPATILHDTPAGWAGYVPRDFDGGFRGDIRAADALAESRNIPALQLLSRVGVERAAGLMGRLGLARIGASPQRYGLSLAVGGAEATPMQLAQAYAALGRGGVPRQVSFVMDDGPETKARVFSPSACWQTLAALSDVSRTQAISRDAARLNVAWKTGTSGGRRDAWCAAVTRSHTVVVWLGNPSGKGAEPLVGSEAAAPLALRLIATLDRREHPTPWPAADAAPPGAGAPAVMAAPLDRRVTLLSPADGSQIVIDADQPADRQKVLLRALPADRNQPHLWWFVNGSPVGTTEGDQSLFWPPERGMQEIRAVDAEGRSATARVNVK